MQRISHFTGPARSRAACARASSGGDWAWCACADRQSGGGRSRGVAGGCLRDRAGLRPPDPAPRRCPPSRTIPGRPRDDHARPLPLAGPELRLDPREAVAPRDVADGHVGDLRYRAQGRGRAGGASRSRCPAALTPRVPLSAVWSP